MDNRINIAVIVGVILTLGFAVTLTQDENKSMSEDQQSLNFEKTVDVIGTATKSVEPDTLIIEFGVETVGQTAHQSLEENSKNMRSIINSLKTVGITNEELSTSYLNIYPVYESHEDITSGRYIQEIVGYRVSNILSIETDQISDAASIIDLATEQGANRINQVSFTVSPSKITSVKEGLIEDAVLNAKSKALIAIKPLEQKIIGVSSIIVNDSGYSPAPMFQRSEAFTSSAPIYSSEQDISVSVNVVFFIADA